MAKIIYEVYQNQNEHSRAYGKYYARVKYLESMNTRRLSNHIAEHGSIYTPDVVYGVMEKFRSCLLEMLLESKRVKIEGLGTFYATIECSKGGAVSKDKFNVQKNIEGLHIRFLPEQEQETNISSRQFLKQAEFVNVDSLLKKEEETENGGDSTGGDSENGGSNSGSQSNEGGSQSGNGGNTNSGSNTGGSTGGNTSGDGQQTTYNLTIARSGSGTSTVMDDSENVITGQRRFAPGTNLNIEIVPAEGQIPTARLNYNPIELTENDGTYVGSFQMPAQGSVLELNSGSNGGDGGDDLDKD